MNIYKDNIIAKCPHCSHEHECKIEEVQLYCQLKSVKPTKCQQCDKEFDIQFGVKYFVRGIIAYNKKDGPDA